MADDFAKTADNYLQETFSKFHAAEYQLWEYGKPEKLSVTTDKQSALVLFLQKGLAELGQGQVAQDGRITPEFLTEMNGFIVSKHQEPVDFWERSYRDLALLGSDPKDISKLSGHHVGAVADSLNDAGRLNYDRPEMMILYVQALREINDPIIQGHAQAFEQEMKKRGIEMPKAGPVSSSEAVRVPGTDMVYNPGTNMLTI